MSANYLQPEHPAAPFGGEYLKWIFVTDPSGAFLFELLVTPDGKEWTRPFRGQAENALLWRPASVEACPACENVELASFPSIDAKCCTACRHWLPATLDAEGRAFYGAARRFGDDFRDGDFTYV